jgi:hypothetical protein
MQCKRVVNLSLLVKVSYRYLKGQSEGNDQRDGPSTVHDAHDVLASRSKADHSE